MEESKWGEVVTIDEHIIANEVLRELSKLFESPFLQIQFKNQTAKGLAKYGTTVNVGDYSVIEWIEHNIQELIDSTVYYLCLHIKIVKEYGRKGTNGNILRMIESDITDNLTKLSELELIRTHYLEVA